MAEPQPNYLSGVNQARQAGRTARRKRTEDMLSPLESAAAMDRLQGVDVGDFSGVVDTPSTNIIPVIFGNRRGGGGYSSPQPQYFDGPQESYSASSPCANGQCGIRTSAPMAAPTTVYSTPSYTSSPTVVTSSPVMTTTVSSPVTSSATTSTKPAKPMTRKERGESLIDEALSLSGSIPYDSPDSQPTKAALSMSDANKRLLAGERMLAREAREEADKINRANTERILDQQDITVAADAAEKYSQADVNKATAAMAKDSNMLDHQARTTELLRRVVENGQSPADYAAARLVADTNTMRTPNASRNPNDPPSVMQPNLMLNGSVEQRYRDYLRIGTAAHAIHGLLKTSQFYDQTTSRPSDDVRLLRTAGMVGKDPKTGEPVEFDTDQVVPGRSPANPGLRSSVDAIIAGYGQSNILGRSWYDVQTAAESDIKSVLNQFVPQHFLKADAERIASLPKEYQEEARQAALDRANVAIDGYYSYILSELAIANKAAGGGTPLDPKGTQPQSPLATPSSQSASPSAAQSFAYPQRGDF